MKDSNTGRAVEHRSLFKHHVNFCGRRLAMIPMVIMALATLALLSPSQAAAQNPPSGTQSCSAVNQTKTTYCDAPSVSILCGGAIGGGTDLNGIPINWTFTNGSSVCDVMTYNFSYRDSKRSCSFYIYIPRGHATSTIRATLSDGTHVSFNENPVSGWQHWFDSFNISSLRFTDANGTTGQELGWGRTTTWSIERLCS